MSFGDPGFLPRAERGRGCTGVPSGRDPEGPGHGGTRGRAAALSTAGLASAVLTRLLLPLLMQLVLEGTPVWGTPCRSLGKQEKQGRRPSKMLLPRTAVRGVRGGWPCSEGHVQCRR